MTACIAFQTWEFVGSHDDPARARSLFKSVRAGWVKVGDPNAMYYTPALSLMHAGRTMHTGRMVSLGEEGG